MGHRGLLIGEIAARSGLSRKALRVYEAAGILSPPARSAAGYRLYEPEVLVVLAFVKQARELGFTLRDIREIVALRRNGQVPCLHVRLLVRRKLLALDRMLKDMTAVRQGLASLLRSSDRRDRSRAAFCPHIEAARPPERRRASKWTA
jgi:DNA-binding transcriptional MerR regulator